MGLIEHLFDMGFEHTLNGGNCHALVRVNADHSDVIDGAVDEEDE